MAIELTLMSRGYCHLCHDMEAAVAPLAREFGARVESVDVDEDATLEARWDEMQFSMKPIAYVAEEKAGPLLAMILNVDTV